MKKSSIALAGGWAVAIVAAGVAVAVKTGRTGGGETVQTAEPAPFAAESAADVKEAAKAPVPAPEPEQTAAVAEQEAETDMDLAEMSDLDSPEAFHAALRGALPADRTLGDEIMAALKNGPDRSSLDLVRQAAKSKNADLQTLALSLFYACAEKMVMDAGDDCCHDELAAELTDAVHGFCKSGSRSVAQMSRAMFCECARAAGSDADTRRYARAALCDWNVPAADESGDTPASPLFPGRHEASFPPKPENSDLVRWVEMYTDLIETSNDPSCVAAVREAYRELTGTGYTTPDAAAELCRRHEEIKAEGLRRHGGVAGFDAEEWARIYEDSERDAARKFGEGEAAARSLEESMERVPPPVRQGS